jgi:hypothetical protein
MQLFEKKKRCCVLQIINNRALADYNAKRIGFNPLAFCSIGLIFTAMNMRIFTFCGIELRVLSLVLGFLTLGFGLGRAQEFKPTDADAVREIYDRALVNGAAYENLRRLCKEAPARLSGSENAEKAVHLTAQMLKEAGADTVWLQPVMVPAWERGETEALLKSPGHQRPLEAVALGGSVGTNGEWLEAEVIEFAGIEALKLATTEQIAGKIVFLNEAMEPRNVNTFASYGACGGNRVFGADEAGKKGAVAVLVRSLTLSEDHHPHTGVMIYRSELKIPGLAISTVEAGRLSQMLTTSGSVRVRLRLTCRDLGMKPSYNVIGELRGRQFPNEIVVAGGHLDSWDTGEGAHDDGAGCIHSIEALRILAKMPVGPKRSFRCVLFMNEENGGMGAEAYAEFAAQEQTKGIRHVAAIESDRGGFTPRGFSYDAQGLGGSAAKQFLDRFSEALTPYQLQLITTEGSGADVGKLHSTGAALFGFLPDSQRYFDVHHAETDRFENVHKRELELGAAAVASLSYLLCQYGITPPTPARK